MKGVDVRIQEEEEEAKEGSSGSPPEKEEGVENDLTIGMIVQEKEKATCVCG